MLEVDAVRSGSLERTVTGGRGSQEGVEMGWKGSLERAEMCGSGSLEMSSAVALQHYVHFGRAKHVHGVAAESHSRIIQLSFCGVAT